MSPRAFQRCGVFKPMVGGSASSAERTREMDQRFLNFGSHGVLVPPASLWWCSAFLLRYWLLLLVIAGSWLGGTDNTAWLYGAFSWQVLLAESPMILLVVAWSRRIPVAGRLTRWLWRRGREIMSLTAGLSLVWAVWYLSGRETWEPVPERLVAAMSMVEAAILVGCWRSPLYKALFGDFPEPLALRRGGQPVAPPRPPYRK